MRWHVGGPLTVAAALLLAPTLAQGQEAPPRGAWLQYRYEEVLGDQGGAYVGYDERQLAYARYEVRAVTADEVTIHAQYAWTLASDEGNDEGTIDREATFSLPERQYTSSLSDSNDYDEQSASSLYAWLWIPPSVSVGDTLRLLDAEYRVTSVNATVQAAGEARAAIAVEASYPDRRDDAYGHLDTNITDRYWFDRDTGMFLREECVERATGTAEGEHASFSLTTTLELEDASYAPAAVPPPRRSFTDPPPPPDLGSGAGPSSSTFPSPRFLMGIGLFAILSLFFLVRRMRTRGAPTRTGTGERFSVRANGELEPAQLALNPAYDPFLPHMLKVAVAAGEQAHVARGANGQILGVAHGDRGAKCATIFAPDSDVCEALRLATGETEFFSDRRHGALARVVKVSADAPTQAYNVYETFEVLELRERPGELGFDTELVARISDADLPGVATLLEAEHGPGARRWIDAALKEGDLAWVAHEDGAVIGVAMASLLGTRARLHSLTVRQDRRGQGIGTALYRVRLRALFDLDVTSVLTECATWNLAALQLARGHGFMKISEMFVESAESVRADKRFARR